MKILFTWHAAVEPEYRKLFEAIAGLGHELTVIAPKAWIEGGRVQRLGQDTTDSYRLIALDIIFQNRLKGFFYPNMPKVIREIRRVTPDVVHIFEEPYTLSSFEFTSLARIFCPSSKIIIESFENIFIEQGFPYSFFERSVLKMADCMIVIPGEGKDIWEKKRFAGKTIQLPVGLDEDLFKKTSGSLEGIEFLDKQGRFRIAYIGRLTMDKGIDLLIEAASVLKKEGFDFELVIVGSGEKEVFQSLSRERGISDMTFFIDSIESRLLPVLYSKIDMLVLPSRTTSGWKEQFGRVLIEAMSCEAAVIGSSSGEIPFVIGDAGLVFREDDAVGLADALKRLLSDEGLRKKLSKAGRTRVLENFTWKGIAERLICVYEEA